MDQTEEAQEEEEKLVDFNKVILVYEMASNMPVIIQRYSNNSEGMAHALHDTVVPKDEPERPDPLIEINRQKEEQVAKAKKTLGFIERILKLRFDTIRGAFDTFDR